MDEEKFTVKETAMQLGRKPKTIYRWIEEGFLKNVIKVRDGYFIPKQEIERIKIVINPRN
jgi:excisionase family DNA binding protein